MGESEFPNSKTGYLKLTKWVKNTSELGRSFDSSLVLFCGEHTARAVLDSANIFMPRE